MKRVLIVSRDCAACGYLIHEFTNRKVNYNIVATGRECIEIVGCNVIDIALIDNAITDINGVELLRLLARLNPALKIIFVNGSHHQTIEKQVRQEGVIYYTTDLRDSRILQVISQLQKREKMSYQYC